MKHSIVVFFLFFLVIGCKENYTEDPLQYFESKHDIYAETIELDNELHGIPGWSIVYDFPLIVVSEGTNMLDKKFFLINLEDKSLKKFINYGRGDCEFIVSFASSINAKEKTFTFFENVKKAYYKVYLDSLKTSGNSFEYCPEKIEIPFVSQGQSRFYVDLKPIDNRYYLGYMGEVTDSMYTVIDTKKDTTYNFCSIPNLPGLSQNEIISGKRLFRGNIFIAPTKHKIALISQPTLIEILDWENGTLSRKKSIEFFRYKFKINHEYKSISRRGFGNKEGFVIGDVTDKFIYVGYSGHTEEEMAKMGVYPSVFYVLVFDWDGNPIKRYDLNRTVIGMVVDKDDSGMYGISLGSPEIPQINLVHYNFNHLE